MKDKELRKEFGKSWIDILNSIVFIKETIRNNQKTIVLINKKIDAICNQLGIELKYSEAKIERQPSKFEVIEKNKDESKEK